MKTFFPRKSRNAFGFIFLLNLLGVVLWLVSYNQTQPTPSDNANSSNSYERIEVWELREDDMVRFTIWDAYTEVIPKRRKWFGSPMIWNDADIVKSIPIKGALIEHHVDDSTYSNQTYRSHSYLIESDQREFGYSATFTNLPHLHVTGASSRLISIGVYPSNDAGSQTRSIIAIILPDGVRDIAITDMEPYKTLTQNKRMLYYYDAQVAAHKSIHIAYTLTGISTMDIDMNIVINNSKP